MELLERESAIERLRENLSAAIRGDGKVALLAGEAGIGKTTLAETFCREAGRAVHVLWGACDPIVPPRPFAPLIDIAASAGGNLRAALAAADRDRTFDAFLDLLRRPPRSVSIVVLEDLHWADDATLELLRVVGRRVARLRVLMIGSYRDTEVGPEHPLRVSLGELPAGAIDEIAISPLSLEAVARLSAGSGVDPSLLHRTSGGNPFFVREALAAGGDPLAQTVRDAVLARARGLSPAGQAALRTISVLGARTERSLAGAVLGPDAAAVHECVARGFLRVDEQQVEFRHELAQRAIYDAVPLHERSQVHSRALRAQLDRPGTELEPAAVARHALGSGDNAAVLQWAPQAARRAAGLGAHRAATRHYTDALRVAGALDLATRAGLLEAHAHEAMLVDEVSAALASQLEALDCWRRLGDALREGDALRDLSFITYLAGEGARSLQVAKEAVAILERADPHGRSFAMACAVLAQRYFSRGEDDDAAREWAGRALAIAETLGDEEVAVHALTTIGALDAELGKENGWTTLEATARRAASAGLREAVTRIFINLVEAALDLRRYALADRYVEQAVASLADQDFDVLSRILRGRLAELALQRGRWDDADGLAQSLLSATRTANPIRIRALTIQGRLRARRGDGNPWEPLDEALAAVAPGELQDLVPLHAARAEAALLAGDAARARREAEAGLALVRTVASAVDAPWWWGELAYLAWRTGATTRLAEGAPEPYRLQAAGRHRTAAARWLSLGSPYERALALAESNQERDLRLALEILLSLGADPMVQQVSRRLRELGARHIPRGPRSTTRRNPAGLTDREMDVLDLLREGMRNSDIAERLVVSPKTVDHHVSSILHKLGVSDRRAIQSKDGELSAAR